MELGTKKGFKQTEVGFIPNDWRVATIGSLSKIFGRIGFRGYTVNDIVEEGQGAIALSPSNILNGKLNLSKTTYISWYKYEESPEIKIYNDDILLVKTGSTFGKITIVKGLEEKATLNPQIVVFKQIKGDNEFLYYLMSSPVFQEQIKTSVVGGAIPTLSQELVSRFIIPLPPTLAEQKAIATALSEVDALITSLDQLIQKKEAIKQGAMQELLTGKTRLQGFEGSGRFKQTEVGRIPEEWEVKNLNRILTFGSGQDYKHLSQGDIPVYGTGGLMTFVDNYLYNGDSVGIGRKGTIDKPIFLSGKFWTVDTLFYTNNFVDTTPKFIYYKFLMIPWLEYNEASGVPSLNKNTIGNIKISLPSTLTEQKAIAKVLSNMDAEIEQLQTKKAKYQRIKQGMMQELLTGKTRLI